MQNITLTPPNGLRQWTAMYLLYRAAFPRAERKPFFYIRKAYRRGKTDIWCISRDGAFLGFAATMNSPSLVMLDYLAISPKHRGRGIGTAALKQLMQRYSRQEFLLEIESPFEPGPDQASRRKRKQFYVNCGMEPLHIMQMFSASKWSCWAKTADRIWTLTATGISTGTSINPGLLSIFSRQSIRSNKKCAPTGRVDANE